MKNIKLLLFLTLLFSSITIAQDVTIKKIDISGYIGQVSPLTSADRSSYNAGSSLGISLSFPNKEIKLFKHPFSMGMELNFSKLDENQSQNDLGINSLVFHLLTAFDKLPVDFSFGFGISDVSAQQIAGSGIIDISHKLPLKKLDFSIGIRFQQVFDIQKNYKVKHMHGLYGLNLKFGKVIKYNKK